MKRNNSYSQDVCEGREMLGGYQKEGKLLFMVAATRRVLLWTQLMCVFPYEKELVCRAVKKQLQALAVEYKF